MKKIMITSVMLITAFLATSVLAATVTELSTITITTTGQVDPFGGSIRTMNAKNENAVAEFGGYQFIAYYNASATLCLTRRSMATGTTKTIVFTGKQPVFNGAVSYDPHRTAHVAISPNDGKIHVMFGHHNNDLRYIISKNNNAATVSDSAFTTTLFKAEQNYLVPGTVETSFTYPEFFVGNGNNLLMLRRRGSAPNGKLFLSEYKNGAWSAKKEIVSGQIGTWNGSVERNPYGDMTYYKGQLTLFWTWREGANGAPNHDYMFAKSTDNGNSWHNTLNNSVSLPLNLNTPNITIWFVPQSLKPSNAVLSSDQDSAGNLHVLNRHLINETDITATFWHYKRIGTSWTRSQLPIGFTGDQLFVDKTNDTIYILGKVENKMTIVTAEKGSDDWASWNSVYTGTRDYMEVTGTINGAGNRLTVLGQRVLATTTATSAPLDLLSLELKTSAPAIPTKLSIATTAVTSSTFQTGNIPINTIDGNLNTRWSAEGNPQWISYDLGATKTISSVKIAWLSGNTRTSNFDVQVSGDGSSWTDVITNTNSSGTTLDLETHEFTDRSARYLRIVGHGNSANTWNSITEVEVWGY